MHSLLLLLPIIAGADPPQVVEVRGPVPPQMLAVGLERYPYCPRQLPPQQGDQDTRDVCFREGRRSGSGRFAFQADFGYGGYRQPYGYGQQFYCPPPQYGYGNGQRFYYPPPQYGYGYEYQPYEYGQQFGRFQGGYGQPFTGG
jgi:hypothetical protein